MQQQDFLCMKMLFKEACFFWRRWRASDQVDGYPDESEAYGQKRQKLRFARKMPNALHVHPALKKSAPKKWSAIKKLDKIKQLSCHGMISVFYRSHAFCF